MWRGAVARAIRGRRGQSFLHELRDAIEEMTNKRLIADELVQAVEICGVDGDPLVARVEACALGIVALRRGMDTSKINFEDYDNIHAPFGIANALAREIIWENDESLPHPKTPEERWRKVRWWVEANIKRN